MLQYVRPHSQYVTQSNRTDHWQGSTIGNSKNFHQAITFLADALVESTGSRSKKKILLYPSRTHDRAPAALGNNTTTALSIRRARQLVASCHSQRKPLVSIIGVWCVVALLLVIPLVPSATTKILNNTRRMLSEWF